MYAKRINEAGTIYGIVHDLEKQFPDKHKLTLAGEFNEIKKEFPTATLTDEKGKEIQT